MKIRFVPSNSLTICAPMKDRSCITGVLKARTTSSMITDSHIVPMKKLQKLSLIRIMQRIPVLTTTLDSRSTEQVPTLKTDSHILQLPKSLLLQTTIQQKKKDATCLHSRKSSIFFHTLHCGHISSHRNLLRNRQFWTKLLGRDLLNA